LRLLRLFAAIPVGTGCRPSHEPISKSLLSLAALLLLASGCGPLPGKPTAADVPIKPRDVRDFAVLYRQSCAGCHGPDGQGNGALALANPVYLAIVSDDTLRRATALGVPGTLMPPFAQSAGGMLNDEQIDILVSGMRSRWARPDVVKGATPPPYAATSPGDARRGTEVYTTFCASCHGPDGKGTPKSGSIVDGSYLALVSDQNLRTTVIAGRPDLNHPDWRNCVTNQPLSAQQVTDVVAWLASHRTTTPGQPYPTAKATPR
jgi:mono/diheme cytochrome c family protein